MRKGLFVSSLLFFPAALSSSSHAQLAAAATAGAVAAAPHLVGAAPAILSGTISSASAHAGQAVLAKLASPASLSNGLKLPAGSQLLGKVTQVTPLSHGSGKSSLSLLFDRVRGADGKESPLSGSMLRSIGSGLASHSNSSASAGQAAANTGSNNQASAQASSNNGGSGLIGGVVGAVGNTVGGVTNTTGQLLGTVTSLPGVLLTSNGTLNAQGQDVDVPSGTHITVAADVNAGQ